MRHSRAMMYVGIADPRCRGKRPRHSRRMRNPQFYVSDKKPIGRESGLSLPNTKIKIVPRLILLPCLIMYDPSVLVDTDNYSLKCWLYRTYITTRQIWQAFCHIAIYSGITECQIWQLLYLVVTYVYINDFSYDCLLVTHIRKRTRFFMSWPV